jgi:hypothetical protein
MLLGVIGKSIFKLTVSHRVNSEVVSPVYINNQLLAKVDEIVNTDKIC